MGKRTAIKIEVSAGFNEKLMLIKLIRNLTDLGVKLSKWIADGLMSPHSYMGSCVWYYPSKAEAMRKIYAWKHDVAGLDGVRVYLLEKNKYGKEEFISIQRLE